MKLKKRFMRLYSRLFARPYFYNFNSLLFNLSIRGLGIYSHRTGEKYFYRNLLPKIIKSSKPVIIDVGANTGSNTLLFSKYFPDSNIFSFEPNPKCFEKLNTIQNNNIKVFQLALGKKSEDINLYDRKGFEITEHSSFYKDVITEFHKSEITEYKVKVETLDTICKQQKIKQIDFLKIDTEGNDYFVLLGAEGFLSSGLIKCIQFEFNIMNTVSRVFFRDFIKLLDCYTLYRMLPKGILKIRSNVTQSEIYGLQNIVAILDEDKIKKANSQ